jgi:hypothetical protein
MLVAVGRGSAVGVGDGGIGLGVEVEGITTSVGVSVNCEEHDTLKMVNMDAASSVSVLVLFPIELRFTPLESLELDPSAYPSSSSRVYHMAKWTAQSKIDIIFFQCGTISRAHPTTTVPIAQ